MSILSPVLVVGATGQQGSSVVRALQALPQPPVIRAISRNPSSPAALKLKEQGIEVVKGDLGDVGSLEKALAGVGSAFLGEFKPPSLAIVAPRRSVSHLWRAGCPCFMIR